MNKDLEAFGFTATAQKIDPESSVYPPLMSTMMAELVLSPDSDVWLLHEHALPEVIKWVEYDIDLETLTLVSMSGKVQDFGMKIPIAMKKYLRRAHEIYAIHQGEDHIKDMTVLPLVVHQPLTEN